MVYTPRPFPQVSGEAQQLALWTSDELRGVSRNFQESEQTQYTVLHVEPPRPREGMVVVADGSDWNPGNGGGAYVYFNGAWVKLLGKADTDALYVPLTRQSPSFSAIKSSAQTGLANATFNTVTWQTEIYDIGSHFASNGWTPPAGIVHISFGVGISGAITNGSTHTSLIMKNGGQLIATAVPTWGGTNAFSTISIDDAANGSDVYIVQAYCDGVAGVWQVNITGSWFSGHWISP